MTAGLAAVRKKLTPAVFSRVSGRIPAGTTPTNVSGNQRHDGGKRKTENGRRSRRRKKKKTGKRRGHAPPSVFLSSVLLSVRKPELRTMNPETESLKLKAESRGPGGRIKN
jgi:hypothetical protein